MAYGDDPQAATAVVKDLPAGGFRNLLEAALGYEAEGQPRTAAAAYRIALQAIPRGLPAWAEPALAHAKSVVDANDRALEAFIDEWLAPVRARLGEADLARFDQCVGVLLRTRRVYRPSPSFLYFPELPPVEFYDRADFPWLDALEAAADDIRDEYLALMTDRPDAAEPYMAEAAPDPRWRELNHSRRWSVAYLWKAGEPVEAVQARCPKTVAALAGWPRCDLLRTGPTAVFSILAPRTRIPPHVGVNNARLIVHMPLVVPPGCGFRVGGQSRSWAPGRAFVFDDTIEHEAWNDSDEPRAVLILDTWNPAVTPAERTLVSALTAAVGGFYGELPDFVSGPAA
jgi:aspartyl/asparaginyl beta-hydroxylase (cupin superfamily)